MSESIPLNSASFQHFLNEHKLMAAHCADCGALYLPPRSRCPYCGSVEMTWSELSGRGRLSAYTVIHIAPTLMLQAGYGRDKPYCAGVVQLEEGPAISGQILGADASRPETVAIGAPVQVSFVERGEGDARKTFLAFEML